MSTKESVSSDLKNTALESEINLNHMAAEVIPSSYSSNTSTESSTVVVVSSSMTQGSIQIRTIPETGHKRKNEDSTK
jgi:hypothetical protein